MSRRTAASLAMFMALAASSRAQFAIPKIKRRASTCPQCKGKFYTQKRFCSLDCHGKYHAQEAA